MFFAFQGSRKTYMNQLPYLNVAKPTPTNYGLTIMAQNITPLYITEYSSGFLSLSVKQTETQHVKPPLLLLALVDESGLLPLRSGLPLKDNKEQQHTHLRCWIVFPPLLLRPEFHARITPCDVIMHKVYCKEI